MKLINSPILLSLLQTIVADRQYLGLLPFDKCDSITQPQKGFWVDRGPTSVSFSKLTFSEECERPGSNNGKCTIHCAGYQSNLIMDRQRDGGWDRSMGDEDSRQKKYLVKCKCETYLEDDGTVITEGCEWKPRRFWKENEYRDDHDLGLSGVGDEPWSQLPKYDPDALVLRRKRRGFSDPRMMFYCEDEAPQHIKEQWMIKPHDLGINKSVREHVDNKGFDTCGNMYDIFPMTGGEWHCKMNVTDPSTGISTKEIVDPNNVPHTAICSWGCTNGGGFEAKEARFSCEKPWIAQPSGKFALKDIWRRFRGYGLRVYKQGMLECDYFDTLRK